MSALVDALPAAELPDEPSSDLPLTWLGMALDRAALRGMQLVLETVIRPSMARIAHHLSRLGLAAEDRVGTLGAMRHRVNSGCASPGSGKRHGHA